MIEAKQGCQASTSTLDGVIRNPQVKAATLAAASWDGKVLPYLPRLDLDIDASLSLHEEFDRDVDPVTYQVLRSRFWNMNLDHSDTIKRVSGTPLIVYMDDFNTSILTENGDTIVCGPSIQYFTGHGDLSVKWTLENRSSNPGIEDWDVFLQNDPYIGTEHQIDTLMYSPVFWEGKLFCWILNNCHMGDLGGVSPGSFCVDAPDIFSEPTPVPPIKVARRGVLQHDVMDMFSRKSRTPDVVALQIRSQMAGLRVTRERVLEVLREYGPTVVKGTMRGMIRDCSQAVGSRLEQIPDGEWSETIYLSSLGGDDRDLHRVVTTLRKVGDRLTFSNEGSDPQCYAASACFSAWRSALVCAGSTMLGYDQLYCPAGVADHMEFEPTPGTLISANWPAALTPVTAAIVCMYLASQVISKMAMAGPEEIRHVANASGGVSLPGYWVASGLDRNGAPVATLTGDSLCGSIGAFPYRDGVDTGGAWWWPNSTSGNAEEWEASLPLLYLYRREQLDSGGAGRWRGGNGLEIAVIPHKTDALNVQIVACDPAINTSPGLAGGLPGHPGNYLLADNTDVQGLLGSGTVPRDRAELEQKVGTLTRMSPKTSRIFGPNEVFSAEYSGGGAFGDPLLREPRLVAQDLQQRRISHEAAAEKYGVVIGADGAADLQATAGERKRLRSARLSTARPPRNAAVCTVEEKTVHTVSEALGVAFGRDPLGDWACVECGRVLGSATGNYKHGAAILDLNPFEVDPVAYPNPADFCDVPFVMRQCICPGCGTILSTECCRADDEPKADIQFSADGLRLLAHRAI